MSRSPESDAAYNSGASRDDLYRLCASFESRVAELERWKRESLQVESEWDPHKLAELLGAPPGSSARVEIMRRVTRLVEYVKALETAGDILESDKRALKAVLSDLGVVGSMGFGSTLKWIAAKEAKP